MIRHFEHFDKCDDSTHSVQFYRIYVDGKYTDQYDTDLPDFIDFLGKLSTALPKCDITFNCVCHVNVSKYQGRNGATPIVCEVAEEIDHEQYYGAWSGSTYHIGRANIHNVLSTNT